MPMQETRRGWGGAVGGGSSISKGPDNYFRLGSWKFTCDECGQWFHSDVAMKRWDNAIVDPKCFELRNPQDFVRGIPDNQTPPWVRPRTTVMTISTTSSVTQTSSLAGAPMGGAVMPG